MLCRHHWAAAAAAAGMNIATPSVPISTLSLRTTPFLIRRYQVRADDS